MEKDGFELLERKRYLSHGDRPHLCIIKEGPCNELEDI